jgi:uncharacterized protein YbjT (DUF2867 family)
MHLTFDSCAILVGYAVASTLAAEGHKVRALVRSATSPIAQDLKTKFGDNIELVEADLEDLGSLTKAFQNVDAVRRARNTNSFPSPDILT